MPIWGVVRKVEPSNFYIMLGKIHESADIFRSWANGGDGFSHTKGLEKFCGKVNK
jgi:hypothetical protein